MHSPANSSRTSPSVEMSPRPRQHEEDQDEEMTPLVWDVPPGIDGIRSQYDNDPPETMHAKTTGHEKPPVPKGPVHTNCPAITGKMKNQFNSRKTPEDALKDCGEDEALKKCVRACTESEEYQQRKTVPAELLAALCEVMGVRSQSKCRFPSCGKVNVRTDRAKEHARMHIGNHPYKCTRIQADGNIGCGATFLRKHDRNRHDNGADTLRCEDCGASIQGKGREYNLQRHKANYCPSRKTSKPNESDATSPPASNTPTAAPVQPLSSDSSIPPPHAQTQNSSSSTQVQPPSTNGTGPLHSSLTSGPSGVVSNLNSPPSSTVTAGGD